jgi:hypothetical protein
MRLEVADELIIEGVARAAERLLTSEELIARVADAICNRFELLTPEQAAGIIDKTTRTLADNHVAWGLDKSVAFGATNPLYFLSQVLERARAKVIKGRRAETAEHRPLNGKGVKATH